MAFRDDENALRSRVDSLEDELARSRAEADQLRRERDQAMAPSAHAWSQGASVWIEWRGTWWRGTILHPVGQDLYRVHYTGWSASWDESVGSSRLAPGNAPAPGRQGGGGVMLGISIAIAMVIVLGILIALGAQRPTAAGGPPATSQPVTSLGELHPGELVWVEWNGMWYLADVLTISPGAGTARIHYQSYDATFDEDVTVSRIRRVE